MKKFHCFSFDIFTSSRFLQRQKTFSSKLDLRKLKVITQNAQANVRFLFNIKIVSISKQFKFKMKQNKQTVMIIISEKRKTFRTTPLFSKRNEIFILMISHNRFICIKAIKMNEYFLLWQSSYSLPYVDDIHPDCFLFSLVRKVILFFSPF